MLSTFDTLAKLHSERFEAVARGDHPSQEDAASEGASQIVPGLRCTRQLLRPGLLAAIRAMHVDLGDRTHHLAAARVSALQPGRVLERRLRVRPAEPGPAGESTELPIPLGVPGQAAQAAPKQ